MMSVIASSSRHSKIPRFAGSGHSFKNMALAGWQISGIVSVALASPTTFHMAGHIPVTMVLGSFNFYACPDVPNQTARQPSAIHASAR